MDEDDKVVSIFANQMRELDDLPKEEAIAICRACMQGMQDEIFRLQGKLKSAGIPL